MDLDSWSKMGLKIVQIVDFRFGLPAQIGKACHDSLLKYCKPSLRFEGWIYPLLFLDWGWMFNHGWNCWENEGKKSWNFYVLHLRIYILPLLPLWRLDNGLFITVVQKVLNYVFLLFNNFRDFSKFWLNGYLSWVFKRFNH